MTEQELNAKIEDVRHESGISTAQKEIRINHLRDYFKNQQKDAEKAAQAKHAADDARIKSNLKAAYTASGGNPQDFERDYPGLKKEHLAKETLRRDAEARAAQMRACAMDF